MRVAMVCPYSLSRPGGVQSQVLGLSRALRARGHRVTAIAPADQPVHDRWIDTVVVGRSRGMRANGSVAPLALSPRAALRAARTVRPDRFDVVHLHEPLAPVTGYGCLLRHDLAAVGTFHRAGDSIGYRALGPVARWAAARLECRVAVSDAALATAQRVMPGNYCVLYNGVEVERFTSASPSPTDRPTVVFLGRHEARKGLGILLEAFERATNVGAIPATLWIVGSGPETEVLRRRHPGSDRLCWLGALSDDEVAARLAGADVLCAPALGGESFGLVLLEGLAARCAVVASDIPGYRSAAGGHATLVPPGDVAAWTRALERVIADVRDRVGSASAGHLDQARAFAQESSMDGLAARYEQLYEEARAAFGHRAVRSAR